MARTRYTPEQIIHMLRERAEGNRACDKFNGIAALTAFRAARNAQHGEAELLAEIDDGLQRPANLGVLVAVPGDRPHDGVERQAAEACQQGRRVYLVRWIKRDEAHRPESPN